LAQINEPRALLPPPSVFPKSSSVLGAPHPNVSDHRAGRIAGRAATSLVNGLPPVRDSMLLVPRERCVDGHFHAASWSDRSSSNRCCIRSGTSVSSEWSW